MDDVIKNQLQNVGQEQVIKFYDDLPEDKRAQLELDVRDIDWLKLDKIYTEQVLTQTNGGTKLKPASKINDDLLQQLPRDRVEGTTRCDQETLDKYRSIGFTNIKQGKVAALLLAGGQGTRLGVDYPKGMYDVGLPSHKSLFQLQAERLAQLNDDSKDETDNQGSQIIWYIMTSGATMQKTKDFFVENQYFGLNQENVVFFEQGTIPCFGFDGKVLLDEKHRVSRSPDGNGGLYESLQKNDIIAHMKSKGIEYVHVYCVDNILVRVCDPIFVGYCISKGVDVGAKVVEKVSPNEAVGIICKVNNQFKVIEYSEISDSIANRLDESTGKLAFNAGNICEHFFRVDFLNSITGNKELRYHLAIKKIPHVELSTGDRIKPTEPNGIKLEKFIFDVFELTDKFAAWEVRREDEFSPLKNADGTEKDNPTTAREALLRAYKLGLLTC